MACGSSELPTEAAGRRMPPSRLCRSTSGRGGLEPFGEQLLKVVVIGDATVGKTSLIQRYVNNTYKDGYKATIGVDFCMKTIRWSDVCTVKLQLWDIAGQERFTNITRAYYRDSDGCILMFDLSSLTSFRRAAKWKEDLDAKCRLIDGSHVPCLLLANKVDLSSRRQVTPAEIKEFCGRYPFIGWREVSVKENTEINESLRYLVECMMGQVNYTHSRRLGSARNALREQANQPPESRWKCAC